MGRANKLKSAVGCLVREGKAFSYAKEIFPDAYFLNFQSTTLKKQIESASIGLLLVYLSSDESEKKLLENLTPWLDTNEIKVIYCSPNAQDLKPISTEESVSLRVLMQIREGAFEHRGGDTVLLECLREELQKKGVHVDVDETGEIDLNSYDLIHIYNFATPEVTEAFAKKAASANIPYVVQTLYEDKPSYYNQMFSQFAAIELYVQRGQPQEQWSTYEHAGTLAKPCDKWDNTWTANHAEALITTGANEAAALRRDYPNAKRIDICHLGSNYVPLGDGGDLFTKETGLKDFVLCVGRLERRKNQLMLLKALENSDLPLVFLTAGMTYEPEYVEVIKQFKRKGETHYFGHVEKEMLSSAYSAAKVHALPSWYELPGLVSLEAAKAGAQVVVTDYGTARDYYGDNAFYCEPHNAESIKIAVHEAYAAADSDADRTKNIQTQVSKFTWDKTATGVLEVYREVVENFRQNKKQQLLTPSLEVASDNAYQASRSVAILPKALPQEKNSNAEINRAQILCDEGDIELKSGKIESAESKYEEAIKIAPHIVRPYRSLAVVALMKEDFIAAKKHFENALNVDSNDARSRSGIGAALWGLGDKEDAYEHIVEATKLNPNDNATIFHLINASYELNRFRELERALRNFIKNDPENLQMQYCLAGCYYHQKKYFLAKGSLARILQVNSTHEGAIELRNLIEKEQAGDTSISAAFTSTTSDIEQGVANGNGKVPFTNLVTNNETSITGKLQLLEEAKAVKDYDRVISEVGIVLGSAEASDDEKDRATILKGEAFACKQDLESAEKCFSATCNSVMYGYKAYAGLGALAAARGDIVVAKDFFNESLRLNSKNDVAFAGLGICAASVGELEEGWSYFRQALSINGENLRALLGLVDLGYSLKKLEEVEGALMNYLDMHPLNISILYSYAGCCYSLGKIAEAKDSLSKILLVDATHEHAQELLTKIDEERV